ncbi:MAG: hypothetical protein K2K06_08640 [Oscillospiraceae bacterium]|nr:hypothetical protein [Ruminococcus sp.]MDE6708088.1 hypothetical protein [Oscillospiraceae bacterium]
MRKKMLYFIQVIFMILFLTGAVYFYQSVSVAILEAGKRCIFILIPSLYIFSILASFSVKANILAFLAKPFQKICQKLLHTDAIFVIIILFSQIGGYPVGSQILHSMYQDNYISKQQEQNLLCVCMGCGFGFLLGTVGGNIKLAFWLWVILSIPNIIIGLLMIKNMQIELNSDNYHQKAFTQIFTESVENGALAMFKITAMILAFAGFMGIIKAILPNLNIIINSILEVSCATEYLQQGGSLASVAGLLSFGGICVHLQISAITENCLNLKKFWLYRIFIAGIVYFICKFSISKIISESIPVFLSSNTAPVMQSSNLIASCCLLVMSIFLIKKYYFFHK